jgi:hypothetical protein
MARIPTPLAWKRRNFAVFEPCGMIDRLYAVAVSGIVSGHIRSALGWGCPLRFPLCHCRVTGGAESREKGSLKQNETGVEKLS